MFKFGIFVCLATVLAGQGLVLCVMEDSVFIIYKNGKPACLATAIANPIFALATSYSNKTKVLVTAAHCVRGNPPSALTIKINGTDVRPDRVILHPFYKPPNVNYDVAVLRMTREVSYGMILSDKPPALNATVKAVKTEKDGIQPTDARVIGLRDCQTRLGNSIKLSSKMLCASVQGTVQDGSPLIQQEERQIFGVAFFSTQGIRVFTNLANSEISSFVKDYV